MLSLIAAYSIFAAVPLFVFAQLFVNEDDWLLARRAPKRPTLAVLALIIGVLAVDFALVANIRGMSAYRICVFDAAVLLVPLLVRSLVKHSLCDLGFTAMIIGLLGSLSTPGAHGH